MVDVVGTALHGIVDVIVVVARDGDGDGEALGMQISTVSTPVGPGGP